MGDIVKKMVAEGYLMSNIAEGLKTPKGRNGRTVHACAV
jgi:hypothetical protein